MAHLAVNTTTHAGFGARIGASLAEMKARVARYRLYRETLAELSNLTDRELADLDLSRAMLRRVAYHAAYR